MKRRAHKKDSGNNSNLKREKKNSENEYLCTDAYQKRNPIHLIAGLFFSPLLDLFLLTEMSEKRCISDPENSADYVI